MALPQVLEHVDLNKWERPAELLRLISTLQAGPNPVPLGHKLLRATGRTARQAKYDHEVLVRLAERDGVLMRWRGGGRRPDSWAIADLRKWRHVPWASRRAEVISAFFDPLPDAAVTLWTKRAARALGLRTSTPLLEALQDSGLSVNLRSITSRDESLTAQRPGETDPRLVPNVTATGDPLLAFDVSKETSSSLEEEEERAHIEKTARDLGRSIARVIGKERLWGSPHAIVVAVVERYPGRLEELRDLVGVVEGIKDPEMAAATFSEAADRAKASGWLRNRTFSRGSGLITKTRDCGECGGSGWIETDGETGVIRCPHCQLASA